MKNFLKKYKDFGDFDRVWVTSDMHFRHEKVKDFEPVRPECQLAEGFEGTPDEFLIYKWNKQVGQNDLVINLGDLHWKSFEPISDKLNGTMLLILGNHDNKPQYYHKYPNIYPVEGIWNLTDRPYEYFIDTEDQLLSAIILGETMFCHYPIYAINHEYNYQRNSKIITRMKILEEVSQEVAGPQGLFNVHGHLHSACPEGVKKSINVCIDFNRFKMFELKEVFKRIENDGI